MHIHENFCIFIQISLNFVSKGSVDNKPALIQVMSWCRTGDKPLHEPMLTQFTDAYICGTRSDGLISLTANCDNIDRQTWDEEFTGLAWWLIGTINNVRYLWRPNHDPSICPLITICGIVQRKEYRFPQSALVSGFGSLLNNVRCCYQNSIVWGQ